MLEDLAVSDVVTDPDLLESYRWDWSRDQSAGKPLAVVRAANAVEVQETVNQGRRYAETYGLEYTIGADVSGHIFHQYLVYALPTQIFIDPQGIIRGVVGAPLDETTARQWVESILP